MNQKEVKPYKFKEVTVLIIFYDFYVCIIASLGHDLFDKFRQIRNSIDSLSDCFWRHVGCNITIIETISFMMYCN
jgi:hypothetical protein